MASDDNTNPKSSDNAGFLTANTLKWAAIVVLAGLAIWGIQGKTSAEGELAALQGEVSSLQKSV
jgi:colicin import membrane protein